jgi:lipopolysaccharide export system protein LptA
MTARVRTDIAWQELRYCFAEPPERVWRMRGRRAVFAAAGGLWLGLALLSGAALAQAPGDAFSGYRENSGKPIDILADVLEVDDKKQIATFKGNVTATQGDFNIRSAELAVTYVRNASDPATSKPQAAAAGTGAAASADPMAGGDIRFIHARGHVLVTGKNNQTATGNEAEFDVKAQKVTLEGDVTLTQGGNVIKGQKLLIDLVTGRSTFLQGEGGKQRLRAVFTRPAKAGAGAKDTGTSAPAKGGEANGGKQSGGGGGWKTESQ